MWSPYRWLPSKIGKLVKDYLNPWLRLGCPSATVSSQAKRLKLPAIHFKAPLKAAFLGWNKRNKPNRGKSYV
jgi:hypothetical protein